MYVIKIMNSAQDCWVASGNIGDPPRTIVLMYAQTFNNKEDAEKE